MQYVGDTIEGGVSLRTFGFPESLETRRRRVFLTRRSRLCNNTAETVFLLSCRTVQHRRTAGGGKPYARF